MASLWNITNLNKGIEQKLDKLEINSNKVVELKTKHNTFKKRFKEVESAQDFICNTLNLTNKKNK